MDGGQWWSGCRAGGEQASGAAASKGQSGQRCCTENALGYIGSRAQEDYMFMFMYVCVFFARGNGEGCERPRSA